MYATERKQTKIEFPEAKILEETLNCTLYQTSETPDSSVEEGSAYPKNYEGSITIIGEKGTVRVGGLAVNEIQHWDFQDECDYDKSIKEANYETTSVYGFGHPLYYKNIIDVFRGKAEPETDGREGLKSLEVLIAAYLAARDGKTVSLPLEY